MRIYWGNILVTKKSL